MVHRCTQEAPLGGDGMLMGEGKGFCPLTRAALSCLSWNSEGSENSKLYLDFQVAIKLHFSREGLCDNLLA